MNILAFLCLIISVGCTLTFSLLKLRKPLCIARMTTAPALLFCFVCMNGAQSNMWIVGALIFGTVYNTLACFPKVPTPLRQLAFACSVIFYGIAFYEADLWMLVAPHINFVFVLFFFTLLMVVYLSVHAWLSKDEIVSTLILLLFNGMFAAFGGIGMFHSFTLGSVLMFLGGLFNFFYYVFKLYRTRRYEETRFTEFELLAIFITSRILLVFGFQLTL